MNNLTGLFDDLNDTKIQDYKKKYLHLYKNLLPDYLN